MKDRESPVDRSDNPLIDEAVQLYIVRLRHREDPRAALDGLRRQLDALGVAPEVAARYLTNAKKQAVKLRLLPPD